MPNKKVLKRRRERRFKKREEKRKNEIEKYNNPHLVADTDRLLEAFLCKAKRNVDWKPSIQRFELNMMTRIYNIHKDFMSCSKSKIKFHKFGIMERGKARVIQSVNIDCRVIQHSLCDNVLTPFLTKKLITNNSSSIKGRGLDFSINYLKHDLMKAYRKNNFSNDMTLITIDLHDYFNSIPHETMKDLIKDSFPNEEIRTFVFKVIDSFDGNRGLGLGSQLCQILAIYYLNPIDHYIKEVLGIKYYGRYMDDSYLIVPKDQNPYELLDLLEVLYKGIGIELNTKKSRVIYLKNDSFTYLQKRFRLSKSGKVHIKQNRKTKNRLIRKIKKFEDLLNDGLIDEAYIYQVMSSMLGSQEKYASYYYIKRMKKRIHKTFPDIFDENFEPVINIKNFKADKFDMDSFLNIEDNKDSE